MNRDLAKYEERELALTPAEQVEGMRQWATVLMDVVEKQTLYTKIGNKKYLEAEAWEIILGFAGVSPQTDWVRPIEEGGEIVGYEAKVNLVKRGEVVGGAIMSCGLDEFPCRGKEGQAKAKAAKSAAQTWAMSKASRLKFSLVPILAGYAPTPAEEMGGEEKSPATPPRIQKQAPVAQPGLIARAVSELGFADEAEVLRALGCENIAQVSKMYGTTQAAWDALRKTVEASVSPAESPTTTHAPIAASRPASATHRASRGSAGAVPTGQGGDPMPEDDKAPF